MSACSSRLWRWFRHGPPAQPALQRQPPPPKSKWSIRSAATFFRFVTLPGTVRANQQATLYAKVPGYLKSIAVDKGDAVKAGQALAEIEVPELLADRVKFEAEVKVADIDSQRLSSAQKKAPDLVMPQSVDDANGKLDIAKANLERTKTLLAYSKLTAPFNGVVTMRFVDPGAFIPAATAGSAAQSAAVLTLMDFDVVRVQVPVPEAEASRVQVGQPVKVAVEGLPGHRFDGAVSRFTYALDDATRTMLVEADLPNPEHELRPGMFATVKIGVEKHAGALLVPVEALVMEKANAFVFVADGGHARKTAVGTGFNDGTSVEVTSGSQGNDVILLSARCCCGRPTDQSGGGEMKLRIADCGLRIGAAIVLGAVGVMSVSAARAADEAAGTNAFLIDLPTALRLAGAQNLDVQLARQQLAEANAHYESTRLQFFPWLAPGVTYHRRDGNAQAVPAGTISDAHFQSYAPGATIAAQVELGDAIYQNLAARQLARAAAHSVAAQQQDATLAAASGYLDLAFAQAAVGVAEDALRIATNYEAELDEAVGAGIAFRGDLLRVRVQTERDRAALRQAREQHRVAGAALAQTLHLNPSVELAARDSDLAPLTLVATNALLGALVEQALVARPELKQNTALAAAARNERSGAVYGPLIPTVGAQAFFGGMGGGPGGATGSFGNEEDYFVGLSWRIGPGGLFDSGRRQSAEARWKSAQLAGDKWRDAITREVVEAFTRAHSLADQLETTRRELAAAEEAQRLTLARKEFGVGVVLENIQAEQDLTRARLDHLRTVAGYVKAEYALRRAAGEDGGH